jgi:ABC-type multidrug transport system fused ATPase/permease subunit
MKDLLRLVDYVKPYWRRVVGAILSALAISVCWLALLGLIQPILDEALPKTAASPTVTEGKFHLLDQARGVIDAGAARFPFLAHWSEAIHSGARGTVVLIGVLVVVIFLFKGLFTYLTAYLTRWTGLQAVRDLRRDLYGRIQR